MPGGIDRIIGAGGKGRPPGSDPTGGIAAHGFRAGCVLALVLVLAASPALAVAVEALDPEQAWTLRTLELRGVSLARVSGVDGVMTTRPRPWWAPWRGLPAFDPLTLQADVGRVRAFYRRLGWYEVQVDAAVTIDGDGHTADVVVTVVEGLPVHVDAVVVRVDGPLLPDQDRIVATLPLEAEERFDEQAYDGASQTLRSAYRNAGYARATVAKRARVDLDRHTVMVTYTIAPGPVCVFGQTRVVGTRAVDPEIVLADVAFRPGEPFREAPLARTRAQLQATSLFQTIGITEDAGAGDVVDVTIAVREAPPRDVRLGVGYDTNEGPRGIAGWRHYNFLGGGRQLGVTVRGSFIERSATADVLQPHWPTAETRARIVVAHQEEDEESYDVTRSRVSPRLEWQIDPHITSFVFYRAEYDQLFAVPQGVLRALPQSAPRHSVLSGAGTGVEAVFTDDPIDPTRGVILALTTDMAGLGGEVHFVRAVGEGSAYHPLGFAGLLGAVRLRVGVIDPIAGDDAVPLFERFYAGGANSVRGYERRHIGPLVDGDPLGGRSLVEMSGELRRAIVGDLGGAVFVDAGQVGQYGDGLPFDALQVGTGVGLRYRSPVGPIRVDLGFPLDRPAGDATWQVNLSIGRAF